MSIIRGALGAVIGGTVAGVALRARRLAVKRNASIIEVLPELPEILQRDAERIGDAARAAVLDGRRAAVHKQHEIDRALAGMREPEGER